jgi:hypothetical protein
MPEMETRPVNKYLPPRPKTRAQAVAPSAASPAPVPKADGFLGWLDAALDKLG